MKQNDLLDRTFQFGVACLKFTSTLPKSPEFNIIRIQLAKCSTSVGANYEESQAGSSKADFKNKVRISLRECREANYWLRILRELDITSTELESLLQESKELKNILGTILNNTRL